MTPITGKLSDIYGKNKILLIVMLFYTTGVSIAGFSTNIDFMLLARGFQGVGLSMFPIAFSIVRAQFPREKIAIGQGIITSMYGGWRSYRSIHWRNQDPGSRSLFLMPEYSTFLDLHP
jgi:MFS family permease